MNSRVALTVARMAFPDWRGRKARHVVAATVRLAGTAWDGGTRNTFVAVILATGETIATDITLRAWRELGGIATVDGPIVPIPYGVAVVEHSIFCGRDVGCRVYSSPASSDAVARKLCRIEGSRIVRLPDGATITVPMLGKPL